MRIHGIKPHRYTSRTYGAQLFPNTSVFPKNSQHNFHVGDQVTAAYTAIILLKSDSSSSWCVIGINPAYIIHAFLRDMQRKPSRVRNIERWSSNNYGHHKTNYISIAMQWIRQRETSEHPFVLSIGSNLWIVPHWRFGLINNSPNPTQIGTTDKPRLSIAKMNMPNHWSFHWFGCQADEDVIALVSRLRE